MSAVAPLPEPIPALDPHLTPPVIQGMAALTEHAFRGGDPAVLVPDGAPCALTKPAVAARTLDLAALHQVTFQQHAAEALRAQALHQHQIFRIDDRLGRQGSAPLRLLALMGPGDCMANAPLDFITAHCAITLDCLYVLPDRQLPAIIPDHDIAFFALGEPEAALLPRLAALYRAWPRPAVNDPARLPVLARDALAEAAAALPGVLAPQVRRMTRAMLGVGDPVFPALLRPLASHAGHGLTLVDSRADVARFLADTPGEDFFATDFVNYAGSDGMFRKYRIAFVRGQAMLCHMAVSEHWMVHYLNAGMTRFPARRAEEQAAMAGFAQGFARRHAKSLAALDRLVGLDYFSIDCAETQDGRLLLFEADAAAIIHLMDPPHLFAYKQEQMRRVFARFEASLREKAGLYGLLES